MIWYFMEHNSFTLLDYSNNPLYDKNMLFISIYVCPYWKKVFLRCLYVELIVSMNGINIKTLFLIYFQDCFNSFGGITSFPISAWFISDEIHLFFNRKG